ncbi:PREDICTED: sialic acid-binding Ig-like lectin 14, partial [Myotis davidii]|uniref:sialic acid-binding Ig-like lectin 14 n=1 Tax=Myotis davidii TaxID=225400 RepID=UPI000766F358
MVLLLLLPLLWGEYLQQPPGYEIQVQESVTVQEGLCVHVPCSFSYPWSSSSSSSELYTYWYRQRDNMRNNELVASNDPKQQAKRETHGPFLLPDAGNNNCSLLIRDARRSDTGIYTFRMERGSVKYSFQDKMLNFQVTGRPHSSRCVTEEQQGSWPLVLTLIRGALMGAGFLLTYVLTWLYYTRHSDPRASTEEGEFTCQARHPLGSHSVSLTLSVGYPPQLLGPSCSWGDQGLHCSCSSRAQPAPSLHWRLGAGLLQGNHGNASQEVTSSSEGPWT